MERISTFNQLSVVVIGDVMLDSYWYGNTNRISPEAPVPVVKVAKIDKRPGGAANVALNIRALGAKVKLLGLCGEDEDGDALEGCLAEQGIESVMSKQSILPTINKLRILSQSQQLMRLDFEKSYFEVDKTSLHEAFINALDSTQMVVISDYAKGTLTDVPFLIEQCKQRHIPVLIDPKGLDYTKYAGATMLTPNRKEFELVMGTSKDNNEFLALGQKMLKQFQLECLLVTRGAEGMTLFRYSEPPYHLSAQAQAVFDVTGAGDTVIGVLSTCLAASMSFELSLKLANYAAGLVVGQVGAATVSADDLKQFDKKQSLELSFDELTRRLNQHKHVNASYHLVQYSTLVAHLTDWHQLIEAKQGGQFNYVILDDVKTLLEKQKALQLLATLSFIDGVGCLTATEIKTLHAPNA
tara:strand:- start:11 stop:1243 length:1233 start_codon:yes stop_codon:yes gene_type:complete